MAIKLHVLLDDRLLLQLYGWLTLFMVEAGTFERCLRERLDCIIDNRYILSMIVFIAERLSSCNPIKSPR